MAVFCEFISVIIRRDSINKYFSGGWTRFVLELPNYSMITDGEIVNVGFMKIIDKNNLKLKVLERGSGITLACGSGACAAAATAILKKLVTTPVHVHMDGGTLLIDWNGINSIIMSGFSNEVISRVFCYKIAISRVFFKNCMRIFKCNDVKAPFLFQKFLRLPL